MDRLQYAFSPETLHLGQNIHKYRHAPSDHTVEPHPVVVPPTWNKSQHHAQLQYVWGRAARELSEAYKIFVIGYSLPPSDEFFRYLYALGSVGDNSLQTFTVVNPDETGATESRFRNLLGTQAESRFDYHPKQFQVCTDLLASKIKV